MLGFLGEAVRNYRTTGAVAPSSRALSRAMTSNLHALDGPRRFLEVGSGTGAFTRYILQGMQEGDRLDAVELSESFAASLESDVLAPHRDAHPGQTVGVQQCLIEEAELDGPYHAIVCGLPFNNFPLELTKRIFDRMLGVLAHGGWLTYFEYVGMRPMKAPFVGGGGRSQLRAHGDFLSSLEQRHNGRRTLITMNIPPAWSVHLQAAPTT